MTCIIGIKTDDGVMIGSDSCVTVGRTEYPTEESKVFWVDEILIGCSGSLRTLQILKHKLRKKLKPQTEDMNNEEYLAIVVADAIRSSLEESGQLEKVNNIDEGNLSLVLAYRGELYNVGPQFSMFSPSNGFTTAGSGAHTARGAIRGALVAKKDIDTEELILIALRASAEFDQGVSEPFKIHKQEVEIIDEIDDFIEQFKENDNKEKREILENLNKMREFAAGNIDEECESK